MIKSSQNSTAPLLSSLEARKRALAPMQAMLNSIYASTAPLQEYHNLVNNVSTSISNIGKAISEGLVKYNDFAVNIANSLGNFAAVAAQVQIAYANAPIWGELARLGQQIADHTEKQYLLKFAVLERWNYLDSELKHKN